MPLFAAFALAVQARTTLAAYLQAHPPQGAWVAIDAERVTAGEPTGLESFDRMAVRVGGLTAIVPRTMVRLADLTQGAPDPTTALSLSDRLLSFLASLDAGQWSRLGAEGIGMNELREPQRRLYAALLPNPFRWDRRRDVNGVTQMRQTQQLILPVDEVARVRLQLRRHLQLAIGDSGGRSFHLQDTDYRSRGPNDVWGALVSDRNELFGVVVRQTVPNVPKPGTLRDERLNGSITASSATIGEALAACAPDGSILADARVKGLPVSRSGTARAGDLLRALALAVSGTYRLVGGAYFLTSDLVGQGARALALSRWSSLARVASMSQDGEWQAAILANGGLRRIGYDKNDPLAPDESFSTRIGEATGLNLASRIDVSELPKPLQSFVGELKTRDAKFSGLQNSDYTKVGVTSQISANFVLHDGTSIEIGGVNLGGPNLTRTLLPNVDAPILPLAGDAVLVADANTMTEAETAARLARLYGFRALWLEANDPRPIAAAQLAGIPVCLAIRPWTAPVGAKIGDPDRNVFGDRATDVSTRDAALRTGTRFVPLAPPSPRGRDLLTPEAARDADRWSAFARLGRTPGLAGVALLDGVPTGYEGGTPERLNSQSVREMGYSEAARLAFIRTKGFDPIDLPLESRGFPVDLREPFFSDPRFGPPFQGSSEDPSLLMAAPQTWREFREAANTAGLEALRKALFGIDLQEDARGSTPSPGARRILRLPGTADEAREGGLRAALARFRDGGGAAPYAIDLSDVSPNQREARLARLIRRRNPSP